MHDEYCKEQIQQHRHEICTLLHDTLAQTLFSASTISGVLTKELRENEAEQSELMLELDILIKEAVIELKSIQQVLSDDDQSNSD